MVRRVLVLLCALALSVGAGILSAAAPAVAVPTQSQTVTFTSAPPNGADWFYGTFGSPSVSYSVTASASSGLPVSFSFDPASADVCGYTAFGPATRPDMENVAFYGPGTCIIHADQAGNQDYLPAEQATMSFVVERVQPRLTALRGKRTLPGGTPTATFQATLQIPYSTSSMGTRPDGPYANQPVTFSVGGKEVCTGVTNQQGVATCTTRLRFPDWSRLRFSASYAGDRLYKPVSVTGYFLG